MSWVGNDGKPTHRPFDGAFPKHYPQGLAIQQCQEVFLRLMDATNEPARDRAYSMLLMTQRPPALVRLRGRQGDKHRLAMRSKRRQADSHHRPTLV